MRNRKFHGIPQRNGVAADWYGTGPPQTHFAMQPHDTYSRRYDPEGWQQGRKEIQCQRICNVTDGAACGIGQDHIPLVGGKEYEVRVALKSDIAVSACVRVLDHESEQTHFQESVDVAGGDWCEFALPWKAPDETSLARLEIVIDRAAKLYVGAVSLLPADNLHGMRPDVIELLKEIGCTLLRWPGGNFAGDYRWQDGLLPVDMRSPLEGHMQIETLGHTGGYDCHEIGTDEFLALCRAIGAEPCLTINPTWEGPRLVAAWVEYCNGSADTQWGGLRAERGYPDPYGVKYWSLGNEFGQSHMRGPGSAADYARHLRPIAEAMRAVDPSIELIASGDWRHNAWFTDCLPVLGDMIDHVAHHHYTGGESPAHMEDYIGTGADRDFRAVTTTPTQVVLPELAELRNRLQAHTSADRSIGIAFDEWNVWHAWYRVPGVVEGIHDASMLNMLYREADRIGVTIGCFFEPINEGAILVEPDRAYLSASGKVFSLWKAHQGNARLDLGPQGEQNHVDVTASLHKRTEKIVVTIVNQHPQEERHVRLILKESRFQAVEGILLSSPNFLPASEFDQNDLEYQLTPDGLELVMPRHSVARIVAGVV